jgi:hypothetical protein
MEPQQPPVHAQARPGADPSGGKGAGGPRPPRWASFSIRLTVLVGCLLLALAALLDNRGVFSGSIASAHGARACNGRQVPEAVALDGPEDARLRAQALAVFAARRGRLYEDGGISSANLWTDDDPHRTGPVHGFEARWWALDAEGREDDVAVDALRYASAAQARDVLALATSARCRPGGTAAASALPAGARTLSWENPDNAYQHDTLFARGPLLYRVSDAPPQTGTGAAGLAQQQREHARVAAATNAIACDIAGAGCASAAVAGAAAAAGAPALRVTATGAGWPSTQAQEGAFLSAVALKPYDVPWMRETFPASTNPGTEAGAPQCFGGREQRGRSGTAARSAVLGYRRRLVSDTVVTYGWVLPSEAAAAHLIAAYTRALRDGCARREFLATIGRPGPRSPRVGIADVQIAPLATAPAPSDIAGAPHRAAALRISAELTLHSRAGRTLRLPYFDEGVVFAYKRALIALAIESTGEPFPRASRSYLEAALLGRAVARWGAPGA